MHIPRAITKIKFSQDQFFVVSVESEGAIFIWTTPQDAQSNKEMPAGHDEYQAHKVIEIIQFTKYLKGFWGLSPYSASWIATLLQ